MAVMYHTILTVHILSFIVFIGSTVSDFVLFRQFVKFLKHEFPKAKTIWEIKTRLKPLIRISGLFAFLAGLSLVATSHGAFSGQVWLRIKVLLVVIVIITSLVVAKQQQKRIGNMIQVGSSLTGSSVTLPQGRFTLLYAIQFCLFLAIVVLSAFRFS
jgi:uncharacterized membrane protein